MTKITKQVRDGSTGLIIKPQVENKETTPKKIKPMNKPE